MKTNCSSCCKEIYINPKPIVNLVQPIEKNGRIGLLLLRRARSLGAGKFGFPAGYIEVNETVQEAAIRETKEETGLLIESTNHISIIDSQISTFVIGNLILVCEGKLLHYESVHNQLRLTPEASEIGLLYGLNSEILEQFAFPSYIVTAQKYFYNDRITNDLVYEKLI